MHRARGRHGRRGAACGLGWRAPCSELHRAHRSGELRQSKLRLGRMHRLRSHQCSHLRRLRNHLRDEPSAHDFPHGKHILNPLRSGICDGTDDTPVQLGQSLRPQGRRRPRLHHGSGDILRRAEPFAFSRRAGRRHSADRRRRTRCWASVESELTIVLKQCLAQFSVINLRTAASSKSELSLDFVIQL